LDENELMRVVDLNCDLGEGAGHDAELMPLITSANIACGGHAGDEETIRATVRLALRHNVAIGAHPGFNDRGHFGRRELPVTPQDVYELVLTQLKRLERIAMEQGARMTHVKPHGALYNMAARERVIAGAVARAVLALDHHVCLFGLAGSELIQAGRLLGLSVANEVFADRTYQSNGSLTPRGHPNALVASGWLMVEQVLRMVREGRVRAIDGTELSIRADTVCLHGDSPHAVQFAQRLRNELLAAGIEVSRAAVGVGRSPF
jgi:UPF0271 protein